MWTCWACCHQVQCERHTEMPLDSAQNWWHPYEACRQSHWTLLHDPGWRNLEKNTIFFSNIIFKGNLQWRSIMALSLGMGKKKWLMAVFQSIYGLTCWKLTYESHENMAMSAILERLAVWSVTSWRTLTYVAEVYLMLWANLFLLFIGEKQTNKSTPWGTPIHSKKSTSVEYMFIEQPCKACREKLLAT